MNSWCIYGATATGNSHLATGRNSQDAIAIQDAENYKIGFLADGCSSSPHSEVFAKLSVDFLVRRASKLLPSTKRQLLPDLLFHDLLNFLDSSLFSQGIDTLIDRETFISNYCLFTVMGIVLTPRLAQIFVCGDGGVIIDDAVVFLDQNNTPSYPAYNLHPTIATNFRDVVPQGFNVWELNPQKHSLLGVCSDAFVLRPELISDPSSLPVTSVKLQMLLNRWTILDQHLEDDASLILTQKQKGAP